MHKLCVILLVVLMSAVCCPDGMVYADEKKLIIGISTGYPPYYYQEDDKLQGICIEVVESVAAAMQIDIVYKEYPWNRLLLNARKGKVDAIMPLFKTKERQEYLSFANHILAYEEVNFFVKKDSPLKEAKGFDALYTQSIGVVDGYSYGTAFDTKQSLNKVITQSDRHLLKMFAHNRFTVGIGNRFVVTHNATQMGILDELTFLSPPLSKEPLYMGFTKKGRKKSLHGEFNQKLSLLRESTKYQQILQKYGIQ